MSAGAALAPGAAGALIAGLGLEPSWARGWPSASAWGAFVLAVALLNATPGVDLLLTVSRTVQGGRRAGLAAALGIVLGCALHALAAALGLAALLSVHAGALQVVQALGAAYLVWLGAGLLRSALRRWRATGGPTEETVAAPAVRSSPSSGWRDLRTGFLTNLLNPKVALFFMAFLPQFVPAGAAHPTAVMLTLGAVFVLQSFLFLALLVALTARLVRAAGRGAGHPRRRARLNAVAEGAGGLLFLALAARLLSGDLSGAAASGTGGPR